MLPWIKFGADGVVRHRKASSPVIRTECRYE